MAKKVYFSPSDQTRNTYAAGNTTEAIQCRQIALYAVEAAKRCGFEALTDATSGGDDAMDKRIAESNKWGADVHIPIHTNAFNKQVKGTRLFCYAIPGEGYDICKAIMNTLSPITPGESDNITTARFAEILNADAPTAYIEVAFHDNAEEAQWIIDHKKDIAEAIVKGLCNYYGMTYIAPSGEKTESKTESASKETASAKKLWRVQVGAYAVKANAEAMAKKLKAEGYAVYIVES